MFDGIELRWSNFAPPETAAYAALPGLLLLRRSYIGHCERRPFGARHDRSDPYACGGVDQGVGRVAEQVFDTLLLENRGNAIDRFHFCFPFR